MYGYVRIMDLADDEVQQLEGGLRKLAEAEGCCLGEIRYEHQPGCYGTFYRLLAELKQASVRQLVVPSLDHLASHPRSCGSSWSCACMRLTCGSGWCSRE